MKKTLPSVSFITCTFNSEPTIKECLDSVKNLDYPAELIEVIIVDGGSKDKTLAIAKTYDFCKINVIKTDGPEEATALGYNMSKADLLVNFPSDNVIPDTQWLKRMIKPLQEHEDVFAVETLRYTYNKHDKALNKYFALFGVNDPVAYYLNKQDRAAYFETGWHLSAESTDCGDYYKASFTIDNLPTVGANGFIVRREVMQKATKDPTKFSHIDTCVDLLNMGYSTYAFVKNDIWHKTGEEFMNFIKKRKKYATTLYFNKKEMRRYHLYNPKTDRLKLARYIFLSLTVVEPTFQAIRGFMVIPDPAWFLHPVVCFCMTIIYAYTVVSTQLTVKH